MSRSLERSQVDVATRWRRLVPVWPDRMPQSPHPRPVTAPYFPIRSKQSASTPIKSAERRAGGRSRSAVSVDRGCNTSGAGGKGEGGDDFGGWGQIKGEIGVKRARVRVHVHVCKVARIGVDRCELLQVFFHMPVPLRFISTNM